jgi:hypothetical protein
MPLGHLRRPSLDFPFFPADFKRSSLSIIRFHGFRLPASYLAPVRDSGQPGIEKTLAPDRFVNSILHSTPETSLRRDLYNANPNKKADVDTCP